MSAPQGYNFAFQFNGKTCIGRTQEDINLAGILKESITKDDQGTKKKYKTGNDVTLKVSGIIEFDSTTGATKLDSDALFDQALLTGGSAEVPVQYVRATGSAYSGTAIMSNYSESTGAEDEGTYNADFTIQGNLTKVTQSNSNPQ